MINVYQPSLGKEELDALEKVFESNWLGKGKRVCRAHQIFKRLGLNDKLLYRGIVFLHAPSGYKTW